MSDSKIEAAFNAHLDAFAKEKKIPVAWQGVKFTPTTGVAYIRTALLPARTIQASLGSGGDNRHSGFYQVSLFYPENTASTTIRRVADEVITRFRLGTRLTREGVTARVSSPPWGAPVVIEPGWIQLPVSIPYIADISNGELP